MSGINEKLKQLEEEELFTPVSEVHAIDSLRCPTDIQEMDWDGDDYSASAEHATLRKIQQESAAVNLIVESARRECLSEDIEYCRECLQKFAKVINDRTLRPPTFAINHSVQLFPLPQWNETTGRLEAVIRHLNVAAEPESQQTLLEGIQQMPNFTRRIFHFTPNSENIPWEDKINFLRILTVYCEDITGVKADAEEGLSVNYMQGLKTLEEIQFVRPPEGFEHFRDENREMVVDHFKILQFKACFRQYLETKFQETRGRYPKGKSIYKIGLNPLLVKMLDIPENTDEEIDPRYVPVLERWLKRAVKQDLSGGY